MQSIEEFMRDYLSSRMAEERREQASRAAFRNKFYTRSCVFDSRAGTLEMIESEGILSTSINAEKGDAITASKNPLLPGNLPSKQRYHLQRAGDTWLIQDVEFACHVCDGKEGCNDCWLCKGKGWISNGQLGRPKGQ